MDAYSACKALVIGVGRYADPQYDLTYARSDAEAMATLGAPCAKYGLATASPHPDEEAMGALATDDRGLVSAFHGDLP